MTDLLEEEKRLFNISCLVGLGDTQLSNNDLKRVLMTEAEAHGIMQALIGNRNNKTKTAEQLGITRGQLDYRLKLIKQMIKR